MATNKCEHNQKITTFCVSDCCVWKEAGGCENCIKKYHNHMGPTLFLSEEQVSSWVRKYMVDQAVKPNCRLLQQHIYNYLSQIKAELSASLDVVCKGIVNQIGYPYLHSHGVLPTYKRIKNKEYRKIVQKQLKALHEVNQKITENQLQQEEARIYLTQIRQTHTLLNAFEQIMENFQGLVKPLHKTFVHDRSIITRINEVMTHLPLPRPTQSLPTYFSQSLKTDTYKISEQKAQKRQQKRENKKKMETQPSFIEPTIIISNASEFKHKQEVIEVKNKQEVSESRNKKEDPAGFAKQKKGMQGRGTAIQSTPFQARPNYSRDVSIDRKIVQQKRFIGASQEDNSDKKKTGKEDIRTKTTTEKQQELTVIAQNQKKSDQINSLKEKLSMKQAEINQKKKLLIEMMKQKEQSLKEGQIEMIKQKEESLKHGSEKDKSFNDKSTNALEKGFQNSQKRIQDTRGRFDDSRSIEEDKGRFPPFDKIYGFQTRIERTKTQIGKKGSQQAAERVFQKKRPALLAPPSILKTIDSKSMNDCKLESSKKEIGEEQMGIKDAVNFAFTQLPDEQVRKEEQREPSLVEQKLIIIPTPNQIPKENLELASPLMRKRQTRQKGTLVLTPQSESVQITQNEQHSLALLLKSLTFSAAQAITYLQSAIKYSENNLSAAQYLSFLYLELNQPKDCLKLCSKMLQRLASRGKAQDLSLILSNNKAAALNILGRYSESIGILQNCLRHREKDYLFKNLGDAYFSISIYEKAIYNYQKALRLNDSYDEAQYNLAVCLFIQENYFNAKLSISKALQMQPTNQDYLTLLENINTRINNC